jgi:hypothetical protein
MEFSLFFFRHVFFKKNVFFSLKGLIKEGDKKSFKTRGGWVVFGQIPHRHRYVGVRGFWGVLVALSTSDAHLARVVLAAAKLLPLVPIHTGHRAYCAALVLITFLSPHLQCISQGRGQACGLLRVLRYTTLHPLFYK